MDGFGHLVNYERRGRVTKRERAGDARRRARAERILDAAADLMLRWGYDKTTVADIAREAGVAKGTIYLHWDTRDDLFAALMLREKVALSEDIRWRIAADPEGATLGGMVKHSALAIRQRPLIEAVLLGDREVLGKMLLSGQASPAYLAKIAGFGTYIEFLRGRGLVRTDLSLQAEVYAVSAIFLGFFLAAPLVPAELVPDDETLAELIGEAVCRTLAPEQAVAPGDVAAAARAYEAFMDGDAAFAREQFERQVE
jgi:AcrR family transcriptional regulator